MAVTNYEECEHNGTKLIRVGEEAEKSIRKKKSKNDQKQVHTQKKHKNLSKKSRKKER